MRAVAQDRVKQLVKITEQKKSLFNQILNVTENIAGSIIDEDVEKLNSHISEKQKIIDKINTLDEEYKINFETIKSDYGINLLDELKEIHAHEALIIQHTVKDIVDLAKKIDILDKENNKKAQSLMGKFSEELKRINSTKKMSSAYNKPLQTTAPSYFFDEKR